LGKKDDQDDFEAATENYTCSQIKLLNEKKKKLGTSIQTMPAKSKLERSLKATGLSQEKIAQKAGVRSSSISRYKLAKGKGKRRPSFKTLGKLSDVVGRSPEQLFPEL